MLRSLCCRDWPCHNGNDERISVHFLGRNTKGLRGLSSCDDVHEALKIGSRLAIKSALWLDIRTTLCMARTINRYVSYWCCVSFGLHLKGFTCHSYEK